jgi:hypothetical protein
VLDAPAGVLAVERGSTDSGVVHCLFNVTGQERSVVATEGGTDLLTGRTAAGGDSLRLQPYETVWLAGASSLP